MDALVEKVDAIRFATEDYRRTFPEPYSLSPNLKLAVDLAATLEAAGLPALLKRVEAAEAMLADWDAWTGERDYEWPSSHKDRERLRAALTEGGKP